VRLRTAPRPIPGNVTELLHSAAHRQYEDFVRLVEKLTDVILFSVVLDWLEW
jgi:hypothetical protein